MQPERGVLNATVLVGHGRDGTRLALDASLSDLALQRPGHHVTAPAARITAGDIVLDGSAVTVGQVAVVSDRLTLEERTAKPVRTWPVQNLLIDAKDRRYLITLSEDALPYTHFRHAGVEFLYMLSGKVRYRHADRSYMMGPGDALFFDAAARHGPEELIEKPMRYLSIIIYPRQRE